MSNPYQKHEFTDGAKLYAAQLTEMDDQIAANDAACRTLNLDTILNIINEQMQKLSLNTDGTYISLSFDNVETNSVAVVNAEDIDFATSLSVTSDHTLTLDAGETSQIIASSKPATNNQTIRFRSNDFNVLKVNNSGLITALHLGRTSVSVICGQYTVPIQVAVREIKTPTWRRGRFLSYDRDNDPTHFRMLTSNYTRLIAFPAENDYIHLKSGETITITLTSGYLSQVYAIPEEIAQFGTDTTYEVPIITLTDTTTPLSELVSTYGNGTEEPFAYTAVEDCYIAISIGGTSAESNYSESECNDFNSSNACIIIISPAAV